MTKRHARPIAGLRAAVRYRMVTRFLVTALTVLLLPLPATAADSAGGTVVASAEGLAEAIRHGMEAGWLPEEYPSVSFASEDFVDVSSDSVTELEQLVPRTNPSADRVITIVGSDGLVLDIAVDPVGLSQMSLSHFRIDDQGQITGSETVVTGTALVESGHVLVELVGEDGIVQSSSTPLNSMGPACDASCSVATAMVAAGFSLCASTGLGAILCAGAVALGSWIICQDVCDAENTNVLARLDMAPPSCSSSTACNVDGLGLSIDGSFSTVRGLVEWYRVVGSIYVLDYFDTDNTITGGAAWQATVFDTTRESRAGCAPSIRIDADSQTTGGTYVYDTTSATKPINAGCV